MSNQCYGLSTTHQPSSLSQAQDKITIGIYLYIYHTQQTVHSVDKLRKGYTHQRESAHVLTQSATVHPPLRTVQAMGYVKQSLWVMGRVCVVLGRVKSVFFA